MLPWLCAVGVFGYMLDASVKLYFKPFVLQFSRRSNAGLCQSWMHFWSIQC